MSKGFRQEVFNVVLAQLLQERGVITAPEKMIEVGEDKSRRMPDLIVNFRGLRTAIEGEVGTGKAIEERALSSALKRVEEGIAHIGIAVLYPEELRHVDFTQLKERLTRARLCMAIVTESSSSPFAEGNIDLLEQSLRQTFDQLIQEDVVAKAVAILDSGIERFAQVLFSSKGDLGRVAMLLGIRGIDDSENIDAEAEQ